MSALIKTSRLLALLLAAYSWNVHASEIGALGYLVPESGIINLSGNGDLIKEVLVSENDSVTAGQPLVILSSSNIRKEDLALAKTKLDNHLSGRSISEKLQDIAVEETRQTLSQAKDSLSNYLNLPANSQSANEKSNRQNAVNNAKLALNKAMAEREKLVLDNDAQTRLLQQKYAQAQTLFDNTSLRAPTDGTILSVFKNPGESSSGVILTMANLKQMAVKCEVFENDIPKLENGMPATIQSSAFQKDLQGKIYLIERSVDPKSKVSIVYVRLDQASPANKMVNMEVNVSIKPD